MRQKWVSRARGLGTVPKVCPNWLFPSQKVCPWSLAGLCPRACPFFVSRLVLPRPNWGNGVSQIIFVSLLPVCPCFCLFLLQRDIGMLGSGEMSLMIGRLCWIVECRQVYNMNYFKIHVVEVLYTPKVCHKGACTWPFCHLHGCTTGASAPDQEGFHQSCVVGRWGAIIPV